MVHLQPVRPGRARGPLLLHLAFKGAAAALSYTYNLFLARDYTMPQPFGHLWTLAVEGQFYVLWALVIFVVMRRGTRALMALTVAVIAISAVSPFLAWDHGTHRDWIYFASLPQAQQLLAGSLLALLWSSGHLRRLPPWVSAPRCHSGWGRHALAGLPGRQCDLQVPRCPDRRGRERRYSWSLIWSTSARTAWPKRL